MEDFVHTLVPLIFAAVWGTLGLIAFYSITLVNKIISKLDIKD